MIVEAHGIPLAATSTGGNRNDVTQLIPLIKAAPPIRGKRGRPRRRPEAVYADRGYDHDTYRRRVRELGITPKIARRGTEHASGLGVYRWVANLRSRSCTTSAACVSAGRSATTSTKRSSRSAAPSSAGDDCATSHSVRSREAPDKVRLQGPRPPSRKPPPAARPAPRPARSPRRGTPIPHRPVHRWPGPTPAPPGRHPRRQQPAYRSHCRTWYRPA